MDRKRTRRGSPLLRRVGGLLKVGLTLVAVVAAVAAIPVVFLWLFLPDEPLPAGATLEAPLSPAEPRAETVMFTSGVTPLEGVLHLPPGPGPHQAVVVVGESGGPVAGRVEAVGETLARAGVAALRYEERNGGGPAGEGAATVLTDDALAGLAFLRAQRDVRWTRLGLLDLGYGGRTARRVASRSDDVAFVVLLSGPHPEDGNLPEPELASLDVPSLWLPAEWSAGVAVAETVAPLDEVRASGRPFAYHESSVADQRETDGPGQRVTVWSVLDAWMRDTGLR